MYPAITTIIRVTRFCDQADYLPYPEFLAVAGEMVAEYLTTHNLGKLHPREIEVQLLQRPRTFARGRGSKVEILPATEISQPKLASRS
jgi:hypothetical protein